MNGRAGFRDLRRKALSLAGGLQGDFLEEVIPRPSLSGRVVLVRGQRWEDSPDGRNYICKHIKAHKDLE